MIVFAVLVDRSGLTCDKGSIVVVNKPEHQLPLFVLTFNGPGSTHHVPAVQQFSAQISRAQARLGRRRRRSPFVLNGGAQVRAYQAQLALQSQLAAQRAQLAQLSSGYGMNFSFGDDDSDDFDDGDY